MDLSKLAIGALAAVAVGAAAYALLYPTLSGTGRAAQRRKSLVGTGARTTEARGAAIAAQARRDKISTSLSEIEQRQKEANTVNLDKRLAQAGLSWNRRRYYLVSAVMGFVTAVLVLAGSGHPAGFAMGFFVGFLGLPRWMIARMRKKRMARFTDELPNAMDIIVRGIRSGLPLGDCLRLIANEAVEPLRTEFRVVMESHTMGMPIGEAVGKLYERVPVPEANFFAIVINIQQKSGGNLSEALGNLSRVIRDRKKMRGKINAMSMEAKVSAIIIGILPVAVGLMVYGTSPDYIRLLWTTMSGRLWMAGGAFMMVAGTLVMKKMISFDI
ncbi:type II secretion system F family protein [Alsobacter sp. SYSU M60028]|uniref:Type II secretion system F family protein n=1 Tax=Alsobacter ponti TaxID=2962936 RepID=A0ABT1L9H5_9HYPH|nr:type II secretion system F family protein [Alsobacter ponti]MCP8938142.1 type II secretion system F family protein [Alsobacter ponti]